MMRLRPSCRRLRWFLAGLGAVLVLAFSVLYAYGGHSRSAWHSNALQVVNLEPISMPIEARFLALDGTVACTISDTLPPGTARFYKPAEMAPPLPPEGGLFINPVRDMGLPLNFVGRPAPDLDRLGQRDASDHLYLEL